MSGRTDQGMEYDVFLSHNSKDKPAVRALAEALVAKKVKVWLDEEKLRPGLSWLDVLEEGIKNARSVAVLVGKNGLGPWENEEMQAALRLAVRDKRPVIPVVLPGASQRPELPLFLSNRTWVDLRVGGLTGEGFERLIWGITGIKPKAARGEGALEAPSQRHGQGLFTHVPEQLFGRQRQLAELDSALADPKIHVFTTVAFGGVGKSSLIATWMAQRDVWNHPEIDQVFEWSFYSQGTREAGNPSADSFINAALLAFGAADLADSSAAAWDKGLRLAQLIAARPNLLILDGLEPLQYPPGGPLQGKLKDPGLEALLTQLARRNPGLCLVTTRESVSDLAPWHRTSAPQAMLDHLSPEAASALLTQLGVKGSKKELQSLAKKVQYHALTLSLLARFLAQAHQGDIRRADRCQFAEADKTIQGGHAFKVMAAYETWLAESGDQGQRQLAILRLLGLFDRPATGNCIHALVQPPVIPDLNEALVGLAEEDWNISLDALASANLITVHRDASECHPSSFILPTSLDAHPLLREYFAQRLRDHHPDAWREGHRRLYTYLTESTEHQPSSLEGLHLLYQAVAHGCRAGLYQETCDKVYRDRILRGTGSDGFYSWRKLGAYGSNLGALAGFFDTPWSTVSPQLTESDRAWLLNETALQLRALGRLTEALDPMRVSLDMIIKQENWLNAAIYASNLSELELTLGQQADALTDAEQSVTFADRSENVFQRITKRCRLANAQHEGGDASRARNLFHQAEQVQAEDRPDTPLLYSVQGFQYCDLLLAPAETLAWRQWLASHAKASKARLGETTPGQADVASDQEIANALSDVAERAGQTLAWVSTQNWLLDIALDHLTLARVKLYQAILDNASPASCQAPLVEAVNDLRAAGQVQELPRSLLTRAWARCLAGDSEGCHADLVEAQEIAERGDMRLHLADIHLTRARLFRKDEVGRMKDERGYPWGSPREDLAEARRLIDECGYHRRDVELRDAQMALGE